MKAFLKFSSLAVLASVSAAASAATITSWNLGNVELVADPALPGTGVSKVYDRDVSGGTAGAIANAQILWIDSPAPGMTVLNDDVDLNPGQSIPDCIAVVGAQCEGPFRSDKRVKLQALNTGAIDLVFDTEANSDTNSYRVYHRLINMSADRIAGFKVELGYGVGANFVASGLGDGLGFDLAADLGPDNAAAFTQFPFGLFGDASENPNHNIDGFFSTDRAGFDVSYSEDQINTGAISANYAALFGPAMLNDSSVPEGYFWDNDGDDSTDPLLMAWYNGMGWEARRMIDPNDPLSAIPIAPTMVDENDLIALGFVRDVAEDLRNINLNFHVKVDEGFEGGPFTLRYTTFAAANGAVPEPATWAMLIAGFGLVGGAMRRQRALQAA